MSRLVGLLLTLFFLSAGACTSGTGGTSGTRAGTESGNPSVFWGCTCETDEDCEGVFDWQVDAYNAAIRTVECSPDTLACRAVLQIEDSCYVNLALESPAYDCSVPDSDILERSATHPERPDDVQPEKCEQPEVDR